MLKSDRPALILIDIQQGFDDTAYWGGQRNNPEAEYHAAELLNLWRTYHLPIFHIQHCSSNPNSLLHESHQGNKFKEIVKPLATETIIKKNVNSAFIGTDLKARLKTDNITKIVITGLTTDHCVSTTARMAGNFGFETFVVADATATFDKIGFDGKRYLAQFIHDTALASLHGEFATVVMADFIKKSGIVN